MKKSLNIKEKLPVSTERLFSNKQFSDPLKNKEVKKIIKCKFNHNKDFDVSASNTQSRNQTNDKKRESLIGYQTKIYNTKIIINVLHD